MQITTCPGCGAADWERTGREADGFDTVCRGRAFHQPAYHIHRCKACGLYFKSDVLEGSELGEYYARVDFTKWEIPGLFPTERAVLRVLESMPPGSRVLDYGCSTGRLLSRVTKRHECYGLEINRDAAATAASKGIRIVGEHDLAGDATPKMDAIILSDVFEHLSDPTATLAQLAHRLTPTGRLILTTGNADAPACRRDMARFWYFRTPEHLCMLSRRFAEYFAAKQAMKLSHWEEMSHYDFSVKERLRQHAMTFAFRAFHEEPRPAWAPLLTVIPMLRRARLWTVPPAYTCTADHVLAVFTKAAVAERVV